MLMFKKLQPHTFKISYTGAVMVIVISSDAIERGLNLRSGHKKAYEIGINCFSDKHIEGLTQNQHNCSRFVNDVCWSASVLCRYYTTLHYL